MQKQPNKIFWGVFGVHASALFLLLVIPFFKSCIHRKPKEIIPGVIIVSEPPAQVALAPQPAPKVEPPAPKVEKTVPAPKSKTPKPKPKPKPKSKPKPKKPAWKPSKVIPQHKRVIRKSSTPTPRQPARRPKPDLSGLKQVLNSTTDPHAAYCSQIEPLFYTVWRQPTRAPYGTKATAVIRVGSDGRILFKKVTAPSGNPVFDQSVQAALHAVNHLPTPPSVSVNRDIAIYFVLD